MSRISAILAVACACIAAGAVAARADDAPVLTIKQHQFEPAELAVPAGQEVRLVVRNLDATPEEFESEDLNREKVIPGGGEATILIGPLDAGTYTFVGEFHEATAKGRIVEK